MANSVDFRVKNGLLVASTATIQSTVNATSTITGALQVIGGAGIGRDLYVGGTIYGTFIGTGTITTATNLAGGSAGQIPYQVSSGVSGYIGTGTTGSLLQMGANTATFVTTSSIYVGYANTAANAVTATNAAVAYSLANAGSITVGSATTASQINTVAQPASSTYYLTFVDSNNATTTAESVYTTSTFVVNPSTGQVGIAASFLSTSSKLTVNGRIESLTDPAGEGGQVVLRGKNFYRWSIDNYQDTFRIIREDDVTEANGLTALSITTGSNPAILIGAATPYSGERLAVNGGAYINGILTATAIYGTFNGTIGTVSINTATNLAGGTAGAIHYQVSPGVSGYIGAGTAGSLLQMGASTATFVTTSSIYVGYANTAANAVTATSAAVAYSLASTSSLRVGFADAATQVNTVAQGASANYFLTFVDSNNATSAAESVYTTSTVYIYPATGQLTAVSIVASQNGTGQNIQIGDDLWIGDINQANTTQLSGAQDSTQAYLVFGNSNSTSLGRSGTGPLTYGGDFKVNGTTTVTNTTNASSTLTGAFQVIGGVGIGGNLYVGGTIFGLTSISGTVSTATNLAGGALGQIPYQSSSGITQYIGTGTTGSLLQMGANTATFVTTGSIYVGYANTAANAVTATSAAVAYSLANAGSLTIGSATTATNLAGGLLGQIPYQTAAGITQYISTGTTGSILQMGANTATFVTTSSIYVGNAVTATNIRGGAGGSIPYQTAAGVTQFINIGSAGQVLQSNGSTASFVSVGTLSAGTATSVAGGLLGQILYQTAAGVTRFIGTGTAGTILQMGTANTATFVTTGSIYVGYANTAANAVTATSAAVAYSLANTSTTYVGRAVIADNASTASQVTTVAQTANATYFLTFVDSNNATAVVESVYTTSSFTVNAASGGVRIGGVTTITNTTAATSTITGAFQVVGGIGVGRDSYFNGVLIGRGAGSDVSNTAVGNSVLDSNSTGTDNVAVGYFALNSNTTGRYNTAVGSRALDTQSAAYHNTAIGYNALTNIVGGSNNVAVGSEAGASASGSDNSFLGYRAGFASTVGYNSAFGSEALTTSTLGSYNAAFGYRALYRNTTGARNTAVGVESLSRNTTAQDNTALGSYSLNRTTTGNYNTALGSGALYDNTTGEYNIAIGKDAGGFLTTGSNNIIIGSVLGTAGMTSTVIVAAGTVERFRITSEGNMGIGTTTPSALLDVNGTVGVRSSTNATSSSTGALQVTGGAGIGSDLWVGGTAYATVLQSTSDVNFKKDITTITNALNTVLQMRGVEYKWTHNSEPGLGLIAQEVQPLVPAAVSETHDRLTVGYGNLVGLLVEAIKEQQQQILALQQEIRDLKR